MKEFFFDHDYFKTVEEYAKNPSDLYFFNSGHIRATIVLSRIFKYAKSNIKMYCEGFNGTVSQHPAYTRELKNFLSKKDTSLDIIVKNYDESNNPELYKILKEHSNKVNLFKTNKKLVAVSDSDNKETEINFTITDNKMFRLEYDVNQHSAEVNFSAPDNIVEQINDYFDKIRNDASQTEPIKLTA